MSDLSLWLVLAGILLIAEITTGTFYLLMVSLGALVGAVAAHFGLGLPLQVVAASAFAVVATLALKHSRKNSSSSSGSSGQLDVGNRVEVLGWDDNRRTTVQYRGASWSAESTDNPPHIGLHQIVDVQGNILKVKHLPNSI